MCREPVNSQGIPVPKKKTKKHSAVHIYLACFQEIQQLTEQLNTGQTESSPITLESGNVSLKNVGSHDKRVKKVLAEQRCVIITALEMEKETMNTFKQNTFRVKRCTPSYIVVIVNLMSWYNINPGIFVRLCGSGLLRELACVCVPARHHPTQPHWPYPCLLLFKSLPQLLLCKWVNTPLMLPWGWNRVVCIWVFYSPKMFNLFHSYKHQTAEF